jgi:hypothetical protein
MENPNSFDQEIQDAQKANPETKVEGTEQKETVQTAVDYETKFKESAKEAQRLYAENRKLRESHTVSTDTNLTNQTAEEEPFFGFNELDEDSQRNLIAYTNSVTKKAREEIMRDPSIAFARTAYAESRWTSAFNAITTQFPDLTKHATDFKARYFNQNNVPDNLEEVLADLAKIYLFDKAKEIGAEEERSKSARVNLEDVTGGDKTPKPSRSIEDWERMARENPTKFAKSSKEFNDDMEKGRI